VLPTNQRKKVEVPYPRNLILSSFLRSPIRIVMGRNSAVRFLIRKKKKKKGGVCWGWSFGARELEIGEKDGIVGYWKYLCRMKKETVIVFDSGKKKGPIANRFAAIAGGGGLRCSGRGALKMVSSGLMVKKGERRRFRPAKQKRRKGTVVRLALARGPQTLSKRERLIVKILKGRLPKRESRCGRGDGREERRG